MSSGDLEAPATPGFIPTHVGKIRILQGQLMVPGRVESVLKVTGTEQLLTPGVGKPTTSSCNTSRSEKGKMRMKVTGDETRSAAAAAKGQDVPALRTVSSGNIAHKAQGGETSDRHRISTSEVARSTVAAESTIPPVHDGHRMLAAATSVPSRPSSRSPSAELNKPEVPAIVKKLCVAEPTYTSSKVSYVEAPLAVSSRGATAEAAPSTQNLTRATAIVQTTNVKQPQQSITVSFGPINSQPLATQPVMKINSTYSILHVPPKSSTGSTWDNTNERDSRVLSKASNGTDSKPSPTSAVSRKSTHDRIAASGDGDRGRAHKFGTRVSTLVSPTVQSEVQTEQPCIPESERGKEADTVEGRSSDSSKVPREVKLLKDTQSQSKVLAEFIDDASRQGKLRMRRSTSGTPTSVVSASPQLEPPVAGRSMRKRLQSVGTATGVKRSGMRSENIEFRMKNRKFLNELQDKGENADDSEEGDEEEPKGAQFDHPLDFNDGFSSSCSDLTAIHRKQVNGALISLSEPPKPGYDRFCFRCKTDKDDELVGCNSCVRSFHKGCVRPTYCEISWSCQDCRASASAQATKRYPTEGYLNLRDCLHHVVERILYNEELNHLFNPLDKAAINLYEKVVTHHMDMAEINRKVENKKYVTAEDFLSDLSWIVHNMSLCQDTRMLAAAKALNRIGREEVTILETCRECFWHLKTQPPDTWFQAVCKKPHLLVWAKLKGFPYWPGKLMNINNNQVLVVFFGQHDKAWVPVKECFLLSKRDPNSKSPKKLYWSRSLKEAENHVANLVERFGLFNYAPYQTPLDTARFEEQLREMVPNAFDPILPEVPTRQEPQLVLKITSVHGKMTASAKATNEESTDHRGAPEKTPSKTGKESNKRITRRASKAILHEDYVSSLNVNTVAEQQPTESGVSKVLAKKRKSVTYERLISEPEGGGKIESLVIHRSSGNWATEPVSKRRKSTARTRRSPSRLSQSFVNLPASEDSFDPKELIPLNDQPTTSDVRMDEVVPPSNVNNEVSTKEDDARPNSLIGDRVSIPPEARLSPPGTNLLVDQTEATRRKSVPVHPSKSAVKPTTNFVGTGTVETVSQPVSTVPVPIKEEITDVEDNVSSTSATLVGASEHLKETVGPAKCKISASNQKARKSFPNSMPHKMGKSPAKSEAMMTVIPKAIGPERNSPLLSLSGAAGGHAANATIDTASDASASASLPSYVGFNERSPAMMISTASEIPSVMAQRVASSASRIKNVVCNAVQSCTSEQTHVSPGAVNVAPSCLSTEDSSISLPDDLDVMIIDGPSIEPVAPTANSSALLKNAHRQNRLPILHPKPAVASEDREDYRGLSMVDMLDDYANQVADQSRIFFQRALQTFVQAGSPEAQITELRLRLDQNEKMHAIEKEHLKKVHDTQMAEMKEQFQKDLQRAITRTKQQMWCRFCRQEANFYCCWNTAYCSRKCQQNHWGGHQRTCEQNKKGAQRTTIEANRLGQMQPTVPVLEDRGNITPGSSPAFTSPYSNALPKRKVTPQHAARVSPAAVTQFGAKVSSSVPVAGQQPRRQHQIMTPKINMVQGQANHLHNLPPYTGSVVNGGPIRRLQQTPPSGPLLASVPSTASEKRLPVAANTFASSVCNGTLVPRTIPTAPVMVAGTSSTISPTVTFTATGRGGSTSRPAPPLPPSAWNQIIHAPPGAAAAAATGGTLVDPSSGLAIVSPRGTTGGIMFPPATVSSVSLATAAGTTNNGDARLGRDLLVRRDPR